ncbi:MAG TPA: barstar family protein, partial [Kofleriaceae bacterium]
MAIFRADENPWNQLDWQLLQNGTISLYARRDILAEDVAWLAARGYALDRFDCSAWTTAAQVHRALVAAFGFPADYGDDLDALGDCLSTLAISEVGGRVIVL